MRTKQCESEWSEVLTCNAGSCGVVVWQGSRSTPVLFRLTLTDCGGTSLGEHVCGHRVHRVVPHAH